MERPRFQYNEKGLRVRNKEKSRLVSLPSLTMLLAGCMIGVFLPSTMLQQNKTPDINEWISTQEKAKAPVTPVAAVQEEKTEAVPSLRRSLQDEDNATDSTDAQKRVMEQFSLLSSQSIPTPTTPYIMYTPKIPDSHRKKILITGGAGFVGSHLVDKLMQEGHEVIVLDNFFTGQKKNIMHWMQHPNFR